MTLLDIFRRAREFLARLRPAKSEEGPESLFDNEEAPTLAPTKNERPDWQVPGEVDRPAGSPEMTDEALASPSQRPLPDESIFGETVGDLPADPPVVGKPTVKPNDLPIEEPVGPDGGNLPSEEPVELDGGDLPTPDEPGRVSQEVSAEDTDWTQFWPDLPESAGGSEVAFPGISGGPEDFQTTIGVDALEQSANSSPEELAVPYPLAGQSEVVPDKPAFPSPSSENALAEFPDFDPGMIEPNGHDAELPDTPEVGVDFGAFGEPDRAVGFEEALPGDVGELLPEPDSRSRPILPQAERERLVAERAQAFANERSERLGRPLRFPSRDVPGQPADDPFFRNEDKGAQVGVANVPPEEVPAGNRQEAPAQVAEEPEVAASNETGNLPVQEPAEEGGGVFEAASDDSDMTAGSLPDAPAAEEPLREAGDISADEPLREGGNNETWPQTPGSVPAPQGAFEPLPAAGAAGGFGDGVDWQSVAEEFRQLLEEILEAVSDGESKWGK